MPTVVELRKQLKDMGVRGYSKLRKAGLIELLKSKTEPTEAKKRAIDRRAEMTIQSLKNLKKRTEDTVKNIKDKVLKMPVIEKKKEINKSMSDLDKLKKEKEDMELAITKLRRGSNVRETYIEELHRIKKEIMKAESMIEKIVEPIKQVEPTEPTKPTKLVLTEFSLPSKYPPIIKYTAVLEELNKDKEKLTKEYPRKKNGQLITNSDKYKEIDAKIKKINIQISEAESHLNEARTEFKQALNRYWDRYREKEMKKKELLKKDKSMKESEN